MRIMIAGATSAGLLMGSYARAFEALGHEVRGLSVPEAAVASRSPWLRLRRVPIVSRIGRDQLIVEGNRVLTTEGLRWRPDLIVTDGEGVLAGTLGTLKGAFNCRAVMIYPDPLMDLRPEIVQALPIYDLVVYACGRFGLPFFEALGARRTAFVPFAWDEAIHVRPPDDARHAESVDVGFVGEWRPDREEWLEALAGFDVGVWGSKAWRTKAAPGSVGRRAWRGRVWGDEYVRASRQSRITLNLVGVTNGPGLNMRAFETAGMGCFVLATRTAAQEEFFRDGEHLAYFESAEELREKVRFYLDHPDERHRIAANLAALAYQHTYRQRAIELLALLNDASMQSVNGVAQPARA